MKRSRVVVGVIGLLLVPAGLVVLFVGLLRTHPTPPRPTPALSPAGTQAQSLDFDGTWVVDGDQNSVIGIGAVSPAIEVSVTDGGLFIDGDRIVGGILTLGNDDSARLVIHQPLRFEPDDQGVGAVELVGDLSVGELVETVAIEVELRLDDTGQAVELSGAGSVGAELAAALAPPGSVASQDAVTITVEVWFERS